MLSPAFDVLAVLAVLQVKHVICDFFLQTHQQIENKGVYGHPWGLAHAGIHIVGTLPVFAILPVDLPAAIAILLVEFLVHYHLDWLKSEIGRRYGWTTRDKQYWWALGMDQFLHQLTYILMALALVVLSTGSHQPV